MEREVRWRVISDYIGAGRMVLEETRAIVGTESGVECVSRRSDPSDAWKIEFGSRCIGVRSLAGGPGGTEEGASLLATCRGGLLLLSNDGEELREKIFAEQLIHEAIPVGDGLIVTAGTHLIRYDSDWEPLWRFSFNEALGASVESIRTLNIFTCGEHIVAAAVDYDSGIGRVTVLDSGGKCVWMSDPGPLSEAVPLGSQSFLWSLAGYGRFETHCSQLNGQEVWLQNFAGFADSGADGSVAMVIGSNESPQWDNWQCRRLDAAGKVLSEITATGRAPARPCHHEDGSIYFLGYVLHLDPSSSRVDYTNFFAMPQELQFQHLSGLRKQIPEYEIYLQKLGPDDDEVEILHHIQGSFSLVQPRVIGNDVIFCDGPDIVAVER